MCLILENVLLALVEMNRQDIFMRLYFYFFFPSLVLFGIRESLWSSFAGGRQYGVWAGEWHSSCSCLPRWWSSPQRVNALLTISQTLFQGALWTPGNLLAKVLHQPGLTPRWERGGEVLWDSCCLGEHLMDMSVTAWVCGAVLLLAEEKLKTWFVWPYGFVGQVGGFLLAA